MLRSISNDRGTCDGEAKRVSAERDVGKRPSISPETTVDNPNRLLHVNVSKTDYWVRPVPSKQPIFSVVLPADMSEPQPELVRKRRPNTANPEPSYDGKHNYYDDFLANMPDRPQKRDERGQTEPHDDDWNDHNIIHDFGWDSRTRWPNREQSQRPCAPDRIGTAQETGSDCAWQGRQRLKDDWDVRKPQRERQHHSRKISVPGNFTPTDDDGTELETASARSHDESASRGVTAFANNRVSPKLQKLIRKANLH